MPDVLTKSEKTRSEIAAKLGAAQKEADDTIVMAHKEVELMKVQIATKADEAAQRAETSRWRQEGEQPKAEDYPGYRS